MKTILVTGGAGFIGSHVAELLLAQGHHVTVLDDLSGGRFENVPRGAEFHRASVCDDLEYLFLFRKIDAVVHAAAYAAEGLSHHIRCYNYRNNVVGSANLINLAVKHGVERFVFLSSIAVYGHGLADGAPFSEDDLPRPVDPYGIAKHAVELDLAAAGEHFGLPWVIFRPHNVYGPRQNICDPYRNVVGIFMRQIMECRDMTVFGDGEQTRGFSDVWSVARPIAAAAAGHADCEGRVFNIGGGVPCTVNALALEVWRAMGCDGPPPVRHLPPRHEVRHALCGHAAAQQVFGPLAECLPLQVGLERMADWARRQKLEPTRPFTNIELKQNLPESWLKI